MTISYHKISKHLNFSRLLGVTKEEFDILATKLESEWNQKVINRYKMPGKYE